MLLREHGVRVESRFSGSGLTPCSMIPSRARRHSRIRVGTRRRIKKLSPDLARLDPGVLVDYVAAVLKVFFSCFFFNKFCT